jgi:monoterpene epsilon-lactone hydrolase
MLRVDLGLVRPLGRRDPFLTAEWVRNRGREYVAGKVALDDPRVSPAYAELTGLPALYLAVGERDTLREGVVALAGAAARAGVEVTLERWPDMVHGWQGLVSAGVPEALAWFARAREYLAGVFGE